MFRAVNFPRPPRRQDAKKDKYRTRSPPHKDAQNTSDYRDYRGDYLIFGDPCFMGSDF